MIRAATPKEIQAAFTAEFIRLGRPLTDAEVMELARQLGQEIERDDPLSCHIAKVYHPGSAQQRRDEP